MKAACVAGRCLPNGSVAAIEGARRWEVEPVDVACVRETGMQAGDSAWTATLGRADGSAIILLRFSLSLPPETEVLEAYVLLDRATDFDADPVPVSVHAQLIASAWTPASVSWASRPRLRDVGTPWTKAFPWGAETVRIDVRDIVTGKKRGARSDVGIAIGQGLAITALASSPTGIAFALESGEQGRRPRLELYVK